MSLSRKEYEALSAQEKQRFAAQASPAELAVLLQSVPAKPTIPVTPTEPISNLSPCKDCGNMVSNNARSCPKCGAVLNSNKRKAYPWLFACCIAGVALGVIIFELSKKVSDDKEIKPNNVPTSMPVASAVVDSKPASPTAPNKEEQKVDALSAEPFIMTAEEKTARDEILKAFLDLDSASDVGVTRMTYGDMVIKARSVLTFEETKLSAKRHEKFLICAEKAAGYYDRANSEWSDYFKYDWMQEEDRTIMMDVDFDDLRNNGLIIDTNGFERIKDNDGFYVPFNTCLSFYWQAADVYVEKMKNDVQQ